MSLVAVFLFPSFLSLCAADESDVGKPFFFYPKPGFDPTNNPYNIFFNNTFPTDVELLSKYELNNVTYDDLLDKAIGIPMYAGLDLLKNMRIMMESFFIHFRARDSITRSNFSNQVCKDPSNSTTLIPGPRRIFSVFHELNLPFEVECLTCDMKTVREPSPKFFRILKNRQEKVFATPAELMKNSQSIPDFLKKKMNEESTTSVFYIERDFEDSGKVRFTPRLIPEYSEKVQDYLRPTRVDENAVSVFCAKESEGKLTPLDIVVNVDTLRVPPPKSNVLNESGTPDKADNTHRFRIEDLIVWTPDFDKKLPIVNEKLNLKLDLRWEPWSCCSACCCSTITCGPGFDTSEAVCRQIPSFKSRRGFVSFFKNDSRLPLRVAEYIEVYLRSSLLITPEQAIQVKEAAETLDVYLSIDPYADQGIPFHSTLLQSSRAFLIVETFLNDNFEYRIEGNPTAGPFGRYGMMIESKSCDDDLQKKNCTLLQQCMDTGGSQFSSNDEKTKDESPDSTTKLPRQQVCQYPGIEDLEIRYRESTFDVHETLNYRFLVDEQEFGELLSTDWSIGQRDIGAFNKEQPCSEQRLFTDGIDLVLIKVDKTDAMQPYIVRGTLKATGEQITLKMVLNFKAKASSSKYINQLLMWAGITGGVLILFTVGLIAIHRVQVLSLRAKLEQVRKFVEQAKFRADREKQPNFSVQQKPPVETTLNL